MDELRFTLNRLSKRISGYKYINYGGCCLYAYLIARQLEQRSISYTTIIEYPEYPRKYYYKQAKNQAKYLVIQHIFLKINNKYYYDYTGTKDKWDPSPKAFLKINSNELLNLYNNGSWNETFRLKTSKTKIRELKQIIKEEFKKYDERVKNSM